MEQNPKETICIGQDGTFVLVIVSDFDTSHTCHRLQWTREKFGKFSDWNWKQFWVKCSFWSLGLLQWCLDWKYSNMIEQKNYFAYEYLDKLSHFSNGFKVSNYWIMYHSQDFPLISFLRRGPWFSRLGLTELRCET